MCAAFTLAQTSTKNAIDEISKASGNISTLQADFTQTKKMKMLSNAMTSKGKMWCTQPNLLRWEYLTPNTSAFILNNGKVLLKGGKRNHTINVNRNRMLRELTRLMIPNGLGKCLSEKKDFQVSVETKNNQHILTLLPQSKELKQMFTQIILYYDHGQSVVTKVEMWEKNGDSTTIELSSININQTINESVYSINEK
ncbi:MAG: outer membrane lipoprotein carrier protein LolA [Bacteroidaceae bacterium]|nr:outer membrane lipoprotein carrier protein LolA [Bacteroidaceae bacterium]